MNSQNDFNKLNKNLQEVFEKWDKKIPPVRLDFSIIREILGAQI